MHSAAAARAGLPAAIVSNFTFSSCYSYLDAPVYVSPATKLRAPEVAPKLSDEDDEEDSPLSPDVLAPLVQQSIDDYSHASLLLRLPGAIPIPSFDIDAPLPASLWVDFEAESFTQDIIQLLERPAADIPCNSSAGPAKRKVVDVPMIVRRPSPKAYTPDFRSALLSSIGVPTHLHDPLTTRILLVSFGGQSIPRPRSRNPSPGQQSPVSGPSPASSPTLSVNGFARRPSLDRAVTNQHLYVPGAPPARTHNTLPINDGSTTKHVRTPIQGLLPPGWIALVCGMSANDLEDLPDKFYACDRDVYVPDLCAACDVLLGKLVRLSSVPL